MRPAASSSAPNALSAKWLEKTSRKNSVRWPAANGTATHNHRASAASATTSNARSPRVASPAAVPPRTIAPMLSGLIRSLRPAQWAKNSFVLAPLVFAGGITSAGTLAGRGLAAFAAFCAASSAVYLMNDLRDREQDRNHPVKRHRPIAAGTLPVPVAAVASALLVVVAVLGGRWLGGGWLGNDFLLAVAGYLVLQSAYTLWFKRVVILDALAIALGFVLRVLGGAAAVGVTVSHWLLLCTIFLSLFLAFSKRRHELILLGDRAASQRDVLGHYSPPLLDQMMNVVTASTLVCYALWAVSDESEEKYGLALLYTVPMVLFGIFRYLYLTYQRTDERNPTEAILADAPFLTNILLWGAVVAWVVYWR